jgi:hypothetical protein
MSMKHAFLTATLVCAGLLTQAVAAGASDKKPQLYEGMGEGLVTLPTLQEVGSFDAILMGKADRPLFRIDAYMTTFVPTTVFGKGVRVLYGGIYGYVWEAFPGSSGPIPQTPPVALVEGFWSLESNNTGTYHLTAYARQADGSYRLSGAVSGDMLVQEKVASSDATALAAHKVATVLQTQKKSTSAISTTPPGDPIVRREQLGPYTRASQDPIGLATALITETQSASFEAGRQEIGAVGQPGQTTGTLLGGGVWDSGDDSPDFKKKPEPPSILRSGELVMHYQLIH